MPLRMYGQYIIQDDTPGESPVMQGTLWYDRPNDQLKVCTSISPYTFVDIAGGVGTVTSVAMTVPVGLTVAGSPITGAGTLAVSLQSGYMIPGGGLAGQVLQSQGASAPTFSTATYPATATSTGTILRADGTNWVATAATFPSAAGAAGTILRSSGTGWVASTATYPDTVGANEVLYATGADVIGSSANLTYNGTLSILLTALPLFMTSPGGTTIVALSVQDSGAVDFQVLNLGTPSLTLSGAPVTLSLPTPTQGGVVYGSGASASLAYSAAGLTGQLLRSAGTGAPTWSTATFPSASPAVGTYLRGDGTNWITSTLTLPNAANAGDLLVASGANAIGAQAPAALTRVDDTNVTLTLGGSPSTALVTAASLTLGWTGTLAGARGGTGYSSIKAAGIAYGLSTNYIDGTGTAGADNTAQTVKTIAIPADTLTQVGDRIHLRVFLRGDTAAAGVVATTTVNGVTVASFTTGTGTQSGFFDIWLAYIDSTHANITAVTGTSGGTVAYNTSLSVANSAGFDWTSSQDIDVDQSAVANNHLVVFEIACTVYPKGVALA